MLFEPSIVGRVEGNMGHGAQNVRQSKAPTSKIYSNEIGYEQHEINHHFPLVTLRVLR